MRIHPSVTAERVLAAVEAHHAGLDDPGICLHCGADHDGVEPDAERYTCDQCDMPCVYGAEQIMFMGAFHP